VGQFDGGLDVIGRFGNQDPVRHDLVNAGVGAVKGAGVGVSSEVAGYVFLEVV
jgi:hypothetical protein